MTPREAGFLLLTSTLGDPARKVLSDAQLRTLARRSLLIKMDDPARDIAQEDLIQIGYCQEDAQHIITLLNQQEQLFWYLREGERHNCIPITRISHNYPVRLRNKLPQDCPGCLWSMGVADLLTMPAIGLVGSRDLNAENAGFAREVGRQAAKQGYVLISGNARGADREAQNACLRICYQRCCRFSERTDTASPHFISCGKWI